MPARRAVVAAEQGNATMRRTCKQLCPTAVVLALASAAAPTALGAGFPRSGEAAFDKSYRGACNPFSHTTEEAIGSEFPSFRHLPFSCDKAVFTAAPKDSNRMLVRFVQEDASDSPAVAFSGALQADGLTMHVNRMYRDTTVPMTVDGGICRLLRDNSRVSRIFCGATINNKDGYRTTIIVDFEVHP